MTNMMHQHLAELLNEGYEVTFQSGGPPDRDEYYAHVRLGGGPLMTGEGKTPAAALWTASPLHGDDEPYPDDAEWYTGEEMDQYGDERFAEGQENAEKLTADVLRAVSQQRFEEGFFAATAQHPIMVKAIADQAVADYREFQRQRREEFTAAFAAAPDQAERDRLVAEWMGQ